MAASAGTVRAKAAQHFDAWHPGLQSQIPGDLRHLATLFRPEHAFTSVAEAGEFSDLTGMDAAELVALRPRRLALHEVLIRVTANLSVPDGSRIEDLGINFRRMTQTLLTACIEPRMAEIEAAYEATRHAISRHVADALSAAIDPRKAEAVVERAPRRSVLDWFRRRSARMAAHPTESIENRAARRSGAEDPLREAAERAVSRVVSALLVRHGSIWGSRDVVAGIATNLACNEAASEAIGYMIEPWLNEAAVGAGYRLLPRQDAPVVMNTKGPSASGKSTLRPLQRRRAGEIGVEWSQFALISPDIWRKQLIEYETLGAVYKYGAMFTGDELHIVDQKLDRYMARKAARNDMPHLLIDRFRFDSFAPDSNEAGSNLLTRFGQIVYLFFMITPPESLVERAWKRALDVGRYKAVDDTLAHSVEAYSGMPELFFTWVSRADKRVHFEFLDNTVELGARPRTVAFGWNDTLNVLDVGSLLDIERYRRVNVGATSPDELYADRECLDAARNTTFLAACVERFDAVNFAEQDTGRVYLHLRNGAAVWADAQLLQRALADADTREGIAAIVPDETLRALPQRDRPAALGDAAGFEQAHTLGQWGIARG